MIQIIPFRLTPGVVCRLTAGRIPWARAKLTLVPLLCGNADPIFLWIGQPDMTDAQALRNARPDPGQEPNYDIAASAYNLGRGSSIETDAGGADSLQLFAPTGISEGFVRFDECDSDYEGRVLAAAARELERLRR